MLTFCYICFCVLSQYVYVSMYMSKNWCILSRMVWNDTWCLWIDYLGFPKIAALFEIVTNTYHTRNLILKQYHYLSYKLHPVPSNCPIKSFKWIKVPGHELYLVKFLLIWNGSLVIVVFHDIGIFKGHRPDNLVLSCLMFLQDWDQVSTSGRNQDAVSLSPSY